MEEFSVFRSDLLKELELVQGAIEKKASVPVLSNVQDQSQSRSAHSRPANMDHRPSNRRTQGNADADLACPLRYQVGHQREDTHRAQQ